MYLWKCWRDTRYPVFVFAGAVLLTNLLYWAIVEDWFGIVAARTFGLERVYWERVADITWKVVLSLVPLAALMVGGEGLPQEFTQKTTTYLLSRPRTRAYLLWTNWAVGAAQLILLVFLSFVADRLKPPITTNPQIEFRVLAVVKWTAAISVTTAMLYSLTFMMGVVLRSGRNAIRAAFATGFVYMFLIPYTKDWPIPPMNIVKLMDQVEKSVLWPQTYAFPYAMWAGWVALALSFVAFAHWSFHRFEPES